MGRFSTMGALLALGALASGCGTLNGAQPLSEGEHMMGVTFGGPVLMALGPPIPVPNLVLEGRSGMSRIGGHPFDVNYGLNLTAGAFGVMGIHGGSSLGLSAGEGWIPSIAVTERLFINHNYFDITKESETRDISFVNQLDVTFGWALGDHLLYAGLTDYVDFGNPTLLLGPFLGAEIRPWDRDFLFQLEVRHMGATFEPEMADVDFLTTGTGVIAFTFSVGWTLGDEKEESK